MRLFVAVEISDAQRTQAAALEQRLRTLAKDARWVRAENHHLTLAFLGEVDEAKVPALEAGLDAAAKPHSSFELELAGGGAFGPPRHPKVLWIGVGGQVEALGALQRDVAAAIGALGHPLEERAFHPHLTLARARSVRGDRELATCAEAMKDVSLGTTRIDRVVLIHSTPGPGGSVYRVLHASALGGG